MEKLPSMEQTSIKKIIKANQISLVKLHLKLLLLPCCLGVDELTQCGPVMPYGDMELGQHWLR